MDRLLTQKDLCRLLNKHRNTVRAWIKAGTIPEPTVIKGRAKYWSEREFKLWQATYCTILHNLAHSCTIEKKPD